MQVRHRGFILVWAKNALCPVRLGVLYNLAPKGPCSRGYKQIAKEGRVPGLGLVMDRVRIAALRKSVVCVCVFLLDLSLVVNPGSPFIVSRGDKDLHELISLDGTVKP